MNSKIKITTLLLLCVTIFIIKKIENFPFQISELNFEKTNTPATQVVSKSGFEAEAIIIPGTSCNKSLLLSLAKRLAHNGIKTTVLDLPGHGISNLKYRGAIDAEAVIANTVNLFISENKDKKVHLIGWSLGARIALEIFSNDKRIQSAILIGPNFQYANKEPPILSHDKKILIIDTEEHRDPYQNQKKSLIPDASHFNIIFHKALSQKITDWINNFAPQTNTPTTPEKDLTVVLPLINLLLGVVATILFSMLNWGKNLMPRISRAQTNEYLLLLAASIPSSYLISKYYNLNLTQFAYSENICMYLFAFGFPAFVYSIFSDKKLFEKIHLNELDQPILILLFNYLVFNFILNDSFYSIKISSERLIAFIPLAFLIFPLFCVITKIIKSQKNLKKKTILAIPLIIVIFISAKLLEIDISYFEFIFTGLFLLIFLHLLILSEKMNAIYIAIFSTLIFSWVLAVGFQIN